MARYYVALLAGVFAAPCLAGGEVAYGEADSWIEATPAYSQPQRMQGAYTLLYRDQQVRRTAAGVATYEATRFRINTAEALTLGNLSVEWDPAAGGPSVHHVRIHRDGDVIDVLKAAKFAIFQREGEMEQSFLTGTLTANLQVPGLRVGDELEFAVTTLSLDPTLPDHASGLMAMPMTATPGVYRMKLQWDESTPLRWQASPEIAGLVQQSGNAVSVEMRAPPQINLPDGAPFRYALQRYIDFTDFADWTALSRRIHPLYVEAAKLTPGSELKAEAARIAARHKAPKDRAQAALRLVQDQVRYVYVGMNGANLTPAAADETWQRRYGDCKGKTAMLLALLGELGIAAEPVLANLATLGDGTDQFLPNPGAFDHVLVRATIGGKTYWMDGTVQGDSRLLESPLLPFRFVLPVNGTGADLEEVPFSPTPLPGLINLHTIDASGGQHEPVPYTLTRIMRGAEALQARAALQAMPEGSVEPALRESFGGETAWHELQAVDWRFDEAHGALILEARGTDMLEWDDPTREAITATDIPGAGFFAPDERKRPVTQDRTAPYANDPWRFTCHVTSIKLFDPGAGRSWEHTAEAMNRTVGGVTYWRMADLRGGEVHTVMSSRTTAAEISAEAAEEANMAIDGFDNSVSTVELRRRSVAGTQLSVDAPGITRVPAVRDVDWLENPAACLPPAD